MLYFRSARHYFCACGIFVLSIRISFLLGGSSITHLNTVESTLGYVACFLNLSFDVISVIRRLHNLRSPFKIPFYLVPPIVFLLRAHAFFTREPYAAFHGKALTCYIEGSMISAI
jgi:hypothetical protein